MASSPKTALIFPGQGAQYPGMGSDFAGTFSGAKEVLQEADELLGRGLSTIMAEGPAELLTQTQNSQAALFINSLAILRVLDDQFPQIVPHACAGHSLGEYSALAAAGWLPFSDALALVDTRGKLMNAACESSQGTMGAVIGLNGDQVQEVVDQLNLPNDLWVANFNCPGQVVITGTLKGIEAAGPKLKEAGARKVMQLQVHGAFHSPLMKSAEDGLCGKIEDTQFQQGVCPVVMNVSGSLENDEAKIRDLLGQQVTRPVLWEQSVRCLMDQGVELFVEVGGKVLSGLNKRIGVPVPTISIDKVADMDKLAAALEG